MLQRFVISGITGAAIGYFTNFIAIRMLFYPKRKILGIQGLLPKYRQNFARKTVDFLMNFVDAEDILRQVALNRSLSKTVKEMDCGFLKKIPAFVLAREIELTLHIGMVRRYFAEEINKIVPYAKEMLSRRIEDTDSDILCHLVLRNTGREIRFIQVLGGIFGFIIGVLQPLISRYLCG